MSNLDDFIRKKQTDEKIMSGYPIIWKHEVCGIGECRATRNSHRWSIPFGSAAGLTIECYDCHKTRFVKVDSKPDIWENKGSEWAKKRIKELDDSNFN